MKKLCILVCMSLPLFGLVWSEDPSLTEEQKEERREINRRISENMREIQKAKQDWIREQIEKGNEQEKEGVDPRTWGPSEILGRDPITWGPSASARNTEDQVPDFYVGGPGSVRPSSRVDEDTEEDTEEDT